MSDTLYVPLLRRRGVYVVRYRDFLYIGSSVNCYGRWEDHQRHLRRGTHHCRKLQQLADRVGVTALNFEVILDVEESLGVKALRAYEQRYILREAADRGREQLLNSTLDVNYWPRRAK